MGMVGIVGLRAEMPYLRGTLDLLGVTPDFVHREEFKDAANMMTETSMTAPEREELDALLGSIYGQIQAGIAADRKIDPGTVKTLVDQAPLLTDEALKAHLVDHVGDRDDAAASFGPDAKFEPLATYFGQVGPPHQKGPTVALIYATGLIARGGGGGNPLTGVSGASSADALTHAFRLAAEDKSVRAILFRIDSPGGSAVAAETIWAAVNRAHQAGKPVIVSMGDVAGSGGYYIAAPADKIVAEPATLTGSIGVVAGKLVFGGTLKKFGGAWGSIDTGANAGMFSTFDDFSDSELARLNAVVDDIYAGFKRRVAEGRKLDADAVEAVAKGRVWSGEDARGKGLVDQLGGMSTALDLAKSAAGIPADQDVDLTPYPVPKSGVGSLMSRVMGDDDADALLPAGSLALVRATLQHIALILAPPGALTMQPIAPR
jgi:protease-4